MAAVLNPPPMSFDAYMSWEAEQPDRHEYYAGEVFAITGARATHNTIALNAAVLLRQALRGTPCRVFISDMKLQVAAANAAFYPDVFVSCDPRDRTADAELVQRYPTLIVEVLSDGLPRSIVGRSSKPIATSTPSPPISCSIRTVLAPTFFCAMRMDVGHSIRCRLAKS